MLLPLVDRFREQARSHNWVGGGQLQVGWLLGRYRWQASSHRDRVRPEDIGQLGNRFREQARSHRGAVCGRQLAEHYDAAGQFGAFDAVGVADQQGDAGELVEVEAGLDAALAEFAVEQQEHAGAVAVDFVDHLAEGGAVEHQHLLAPVHHGGGVDGLYVADLPCVVGDLLAGFEAQVAAVDGDVDRAVEAGHADLLVGVAQVEARLTGAQPPCSGLHGQRQACGLHFDFAADQFKSLHAVFDVALVDAGLGV